MIYSFSPAVNTQTRVLVIGSMPGEASLKAQEYYAYKYNQFWKIAFEIFAHGRTPANYEDKINILLSNGVGLWDALAACERPGSLDGNISKPTPNNFPELFAQYPKIHTLLFNGQAARLHFKRAFGDAGKHCLTLPSTSPAHAALSYNEKLRQWRQAFESALKKDN